MSFFETLSLLPDDPIVHLPILFAADPRDHKINLGVGSYKDSEGKSMPLVAVKKAEEILPASKPFKEYLPIEGSQEFIKLNETLILGKDLSNINTFSVQAIGGTGALRIGADLLAKLPSKKIYVPTPTWPNHKLTFSKAGLEVLSYRYYDHATYTIDFKSLCDDIKNMPEGSAILLHACCHNPSGIDPSPQEWKILSGLIKEKKIIPFFDLAYQGFVSSLDEDAFAARYFAREGHQMLIANSLSKNMGLYGERVGGLVVISNHQEEMHTIASQCKQIIRASYSTPPLHGAEIASLILNTDSLYNEWVEELSNMRLRLTEMRHNLMSGLSSICPAKDWSFLSRQKGFFSFLGLMPDQVRRLHDEYAIFMPASGRINVAGLNGHNIDQVIQAIKAVQES